VPQACGALLGSGAGSLVGAVAGVGVSAGATAVLYLTGHGTYEGPGPAGAVLFLSFITVPLGVIAGATLGAAGGMTFAGTSCAATEAACAP
jgi:hypothetical protein